MSEPVALCKPHNNVANALSIEALAASRISGEGTLTSTSFYI